MKPSLYFESPIISQKVYKDILSDIVILATYVTY